MRFTKATWLIFTVLLLTGCAAKPIAKGDSSVQRKVVSFPKVGEQVHAVVGGVVHIHADYQSRYIFQLENPFSISFMLGKIMVAKDMPISEASLDGEDVFCTHGKVYYDPLMSNPIRIACFKSETKGTFNIVKVAPGEMWFSKDITPAISYLSKELPILVTSWPLKRELVFEGAQNESIFFTQKIYEQSVETPSRIKPHVVKVVSLPSKVSVEGMEINVIKLTNNSLTYTIEKPWTVVVDK